MEDSCIYSGCPGRILVHGMVNPALFYLIQLLELKAVWKQQLSCGHWAVLDSQHQSALPSRTYPTR